MGQSAAAVRPFGNPGYDGGHQRHHRMADAEPVPRLVEIHDDVDVSTSMNAPTDQQLIDFVIREARLIDQHRFEEWLDLFAEDGFYWMPLEWGQTDPRLAASLMYEDKLLLTIRVERLKEIGR